MYTGLEGREERAQWDKLLPFTLIVTWYFLFYFVMICIFPPFDLKRTDHSEIAKL